jgi:hypothetical protein
MFNSRAMYFLYGTLAGPVLTHLVRPLAREIIKGGILLGRGFTSITAEVADELGSLTEEAASELDTGRRTRRRSKVVAN